eukprot:scaffold2354_cov63-Phaeocystis_antarctica.AAC.1
MRLRAQLAVAHRDAHQHELVAHGVRGAEVALAAQRGALRHHDVDERGVDLLVRVARLARVRLVRVRVRARPHVRRVRSAAGVEAAAGRGGSRPVASGRTAAEAGLLACEDVGTAVAAGPVARLRPIVKAHGDWSSAGAGQRPEKRLSGQRPERRG